jgi:feruloyl esterase
MPAGELTTADWDLVARAAVARCDGDDGLIDGVIADPRTCGFRVRELECAGASGDCLSPEKVITAEAIIAPLTDDRGTTYDHGLLPGVTSRPGGLPPLPLQMFGDIVHRGEAWDARQFDIAHDLPAARAAFPTMDARSTDLAAFAARGGKLLLYHGWADASVQPQSTIDFFQQLQPAAGTPKGDFARLYMVPGMLHCRGGTGTDRFGASEDRQPTADRSSDMLAALIAWVERDQKPDALVAKRLDAAGAIDRTRPLCPFPTEARYTGRGDPSDATSFTCAATAALSTGAGSAHARADQSHYEQITLSNVALPTQGEGR